MKKVFSKKVFGVIKRLLVSAVAIALIFVLPTVGLKTDDNLSMIYSTFLGAKSKYQGIIEIWNVDTFESGTNSKTSFLNSAAKSFQNKNKGLYIMVRNLTEYECENLLAKGESPDLFSCSYGVAEKFSKYITAFDKNLKFDTASNFLQAGTVSGELRAVAWCRGNYCLISTKAKIDAASKAGAYSNLSKELADKVGDESVFDALTSNKIKLSDIALLSGFKEEKKNKTKVTYSLEYGTGNYQLPQKAFEAYNNKGLVSVSDIDINKENAGQSQYSAYSNFVAGKSTILLGTQRDIARMENRQSLGKVSDVVYQPLTSFTDLVQFMLLSNSDNKLKREYSEKFVQFLVGWSVQEKLGSVGMFATCSLKQNLYESGVMSDISSQKIEDYSVKSLF